MKKIIFASLLFAVSSFANAHPGHGLQSAYSGFMHPLTGWDHLLVILAVGVWAAKLGGKARWQMPLTFVGMMMVGAVLGMAGLSFSGVEAAIAASVVAMGILLIITLPMRLISQLAITALFAVLHGMAHGVELHSKSSLAALAGMLIATATLHAFGFLIGSQRYVISKWLQNSLACIMFFVGSCLLFS
jgi:urease accessory protein